MTFRVVTFFSPYIDDKSRNSLSAKLAETGLPIFSPVEFNKLGEPKTESKNQQIALFIGSGGTEQLVQEFLSGNQQIQSIALLSYSERNSLAATLEINAFLKSKSFPTYHSHFSKLDDLALSLRSWAEFSQVVEKISNSRLGIIGEPSPWLIASQIDHTALQKKWGLTIVEIPMDPLLKPIGVVTEENKSLSIELKSKASCVESSDEAVEAAGSIYEKLHKIVQQENLNAVTIKCFTLVNETEITSCIALSLLNDIKTITAGCEGDIPSTFTMMIAKYLTGEPAFMANVIDVNSSENSIVLAHCTVPTSMVEDFDLTTHYETGLSVAPRGRFPIVDVTILRLGGADLTDYWVSCGQIVENLSLENNCRTQVRVKLDESVSYFLDAPLGNHHILIRGNHAKQFRMFMEFMEFSKLTLK